MSSSVGFSRDMLKKGGGNFHDPTANIAIDNDECLSSTKIGIPQKQKRELKRYRFRKGLTPLEKCVKLARENGMTYGEMQILETCGKIRISKDYKRIIWI